MDSQSTVVKYIPVTRKDCRRSVLTVEFTVETPPRPRSSDPFSVPSQLEVFFVFFKEEEEEEEEEEEDSSPQQPSFVFHNHRDLTSSSRCKILVDKMVSSVKILADEFGRHSNEIAFVLTKIATNATVRWLVGCAMKVRFGFLKNEEEVEVVWDAESYVGSLEKIEFDQNRNHEFLGKRGCYMCDDVFFDLEDEKKKKKNDIARKLPCSHVFHHKCLCQWLRRTRVCPICTW